MLTAISFNHSKVSSTASIKNKIVLIAGAGLGQATANFLVRKGIIAITAKRFIWTK